MKKNLLRKTFVLALSAIMLSGAFVGCGTKSAQTANGSNVSTPKDPKDFKGEITFWHFNKDEGPNLAKAFMEKYPNVKVNIQITADTDMGYQNKVSAAIRAGSGMPDVFVAESAFVKRFVNLTGGFDDLSKAPYTAGSLTGKMIPYTVGIGKDSKGTLRALSWQATPAGVGYKRELAKQYLGTDDPAKISEMLSSPDKIIETGEKVKQASGGKVKLFAGVEELKKIYLGGRSAGWEKDGSLNIDPKMNEFIDLAKKLRDGGFDSAYSQWTPAWAASIAAQDSICYAIPTWGVPYIINSNDKNAKGKWGLANGPFPYFWGGTWIGISQQSKNKEIAWEFVKFLTSDKEHLSKWADDTGDFVNNTDVINEKASSGKLDPTINENIYSLYKDQLSKINGDIFTPNSDKIENDFTDELNTFLAGKYKSKDEFLKAFKDKVKSDFPDLKVN